MPDREADRSPASLDLAIAWLGRRIAEIAAAPPAGAPPAGRPSPTGGAARSGSPPASGHGKVPADRSSRAAVPSRAAAGAPPRSDLEAATAALEQLQAASEALAQLTDANSGPAIERHDAGGVGPIATPAPA